MKEPIVRPRKTTRGYGHSHYEIRYESLSEFELEKGRSLARMFDKSLKLPENHTHYYDHGYRSGELHESNLWQIAAEINNARPFSLRETIDVPDFHIGLLLDCSGSMNASVSSFGNPFNHHERPSVMTAARILALGMGMSMSNREGLHLSVCGHTEEGGSVHLLMAKRPTTEFCTERFGTLTAQSGNLDGLALVAFAREMHRAMRAGEPGLLVLISDGAPCHSAVLMKKAFDICKKLYNITVFPIGVGECLGDEMCKTLYGAGNYILAKDVLSAAPSIVTRANLLIEELKPM